MKQSMRSIFTKIPSLLGILIAIVSFCLLICMLVLAKAIPPNSEGFHPSFVSWIFSVIFALISLPFFITDAVLSILKAVSKIHLPFNIALATIILISPILLLIFGATAGYGYIVWNVYYLLLFVLEIVSFILCIITTVKHKEKTP